MKAKFNIGDEVEVISNGSIGCIKDITSYSKNSNVVYMVEIAGKQKAYLESNLRIVRKLNVIENLDLNEMTVSLKIEDKINEIIAKLNLMEPTSEESQLLNAAKLQMYLATNNNYDEETKGNIGTSVTVNELFHGLINGKMDSIINSYIFSEILNKVGNKVLNVALKDESGNYYLSNLVLIGNEYYYFDVTLEHSVFIENGGEIRNFVLCCGALGRGSYEQFFKPMCLIDFHNKLAENELPDNIARLDIDIDLVNKIINI